MVPQAPCPNFFLEDNLNAENDNHADLLYGAESIADFLQLSKTVVYHLVAGKSMPTFKMGKKVCARRTTLLGWLADKEATARMAA